MTIRLYKPWNNIADLIYYARHADAVPREVRVDIRATFSGSSTYHYSMGELTAAAANGDLLNTTVLRLTNELGEVMEGKAYYTHLALLAPEDSSTVEKYLAGLSWEVLGWVPDPGLRADSQFPRRTHPDAYTGFAPVLTEAELDEALVRLYPEFEFSLPEDSMFGGPRVTARLKPEVIESLPPIQSRYLPDSWRGGKTLNVGPRHYRDESIYEFKDGAWTAERNPSGENLYTAPGPDVVGMGRIMLEIRHERNRRRQYILDTLNNQRIEQQVEEERKRQVARQESLERFIAFREKQEEQGREPNMVIADLPFVEAGKGIKSSRRWGIEVETGAGRDLSGTPSGWDSKDDGSLESAYEDRYIDPDDCEVADHRPEIEVEEVYAPDNVDHGMFYIENPFYTDPDYCSGCGSVEGDYYEDCVELVSPILSSMHSRGLAQICDDLADSPVTDTAGVHVHVEANDLTVKQVRELVLGYDHIERFIEASYDRTRRGYCKRRSAEEILRIARQASEAQTVDELYKGDRYTTVNLLALEDHGTIEFRAMGPRYEYNHLIRWAMFCREMVNAVKNGATSKHFARAKSWGDVLAIFAKYGEEYPKIVANSIESAEELAEDFAVAV